MLRNFCFGVNYWSCVLVKMFKKFNILQDGDFIVIQTRVSNLELEIEKLKTQILSLRGLVNRKIGFDNPKPQTETNKSPDGLDNLRY